MDRFLIKYRSVDKQLALVFLFTFIESIRHNISINLGSNVMKDLLTADDVFMVFDGKRMASAGIKCNRQSMYDNTSVSVCLYQFYEVAA